MTLKHCSIVQFDALTPQPSFHACFVIEPFRSATVHHDDFPTIALIQLVNSVRENLCAPSYVLFHRTTVQKSPLFLTILVFVLPIPIGVRLISLRFVPNPENFGDSILHRSLPMLS